MISVILYGRNDAHGYNLHKRAAISLNCIAHVLDGADDEILFVDYNTPDDLPTFVEAIQDTLTPRARAITRGLRVRPVHHARFASSTHLVALEPIARNVALRRANPANRWILSTNTDMVFVPQPGFTSLSAGVASLEDGFYHLPRFELPEALWESLDRSDPREIIQRTGVWARQFHLNEIVYGSPDIVYDGPGDFQLALRSDLLAIDGFHEEMLLGWHVDSNLARRMRILRGEVRSALPIARGYHCDHTRQATVLHKRDRLQNDSRRFFDEVTTPYIPEQRTSFGLAGEPVEEVNLAADTSSQRYVAALSKVLPTPSLGDYEARYVTASYDLEPYDPRHVTPYLLDLLSCAPPRVKIAYAGVTEEMAALLSSGLSTLSPAATIITPAGWGLVQPDQTTAVSTEDWLSAPDIFVFEMDTTRPDDSEAAKERRRSLLQLFERFVEYPHKRPVRVIAVNAIHNHFEQRITAKVNCTATPFSSRIRHGYLMAGQAESALGGLVTEEIGRLLALSTGRRLRVPDAEVTILLSLIATLASATPSRPQTELAHRHLDALIGLLETPGLSTLLDISPATLARIRTNLVRIRVDRTGLAAGQPQEAEAQGSRLANVDDWENPNFLKWAERFGASDSYNSFNRTVWLWRRVAILVELEACGYLAEGSARNGVKVLVVTQGQDPLISWLNGLGFHVVECAVTSGAMAPPSSSFDCMICLDPSFLDDLKKAPDGFFDALRAVVPGGRVLVSFFARLDSGIDNGSFPRWLLRKPGFNGELASALGCAGPDTAYPISGRTLQRRSNAGFSDDTFVQDYWGLRTLGLFSLARLDTPPDPAKLGKLIRWRPFGFVGRAVAFTRQVASWVARSGVKSRSA